MVKKRNLGSENIETVRESKRRRKQPDPVPAGHAQAENRADIDEQLRTEVEELRRQVLELHAGKDQDDRSIRGAEWLARLAEENPDPVLQVSLDGAVQYRNPAAFSLCRQWNPSDELIVSPVIHNLVQAAYARAEVIRREMIVGEHSYLVTIAPAPAPANYVNVYASEITAGKKAEEARREAEKRLALALSGTRMGMYDRNLITGEIRGTELLARLLDLRTTTTTTTTTTTLSQVYHYHDWAGRVHPEDWTRIETQLQRCMTERAPFEADYRIMHHDGRVRWVADRGVFQYDAAGRPTSIVGILVDVTERKQADEALRESEEKYRRIVETATEAIVMADAEARTVFANARWSEIFGYSLEEARHLSHFDMVFPEDVAAMKARWEARKRGQNERYEFRMRRKDGSPVWVLIGVAPRFGPEGQFLGTLVMITDITQRKRAEETLRELNATLESKVTQRTAQLQHRARQLQKLTLEMSEAEDRERKRLAEILHDDLQQLMAAAKFQLSLMRDQVKHDASLHATALEIDHMLKEAIAKSRSLSHELSPAVSHQGDFTEALDWLAGQMQAKHGLVVHVHGTGELHLRSDAIKAFVYRTAQELLFNAAKHAQVKDASVRIRRRGSYLGLLVSDRGRGFDPQGLREAGGFGLLSIRERIELLGGRMKIRSAPGRGSTFFVVVPDGETTAPLNDGARSRAPSATEPEGRLRVLLADDHQVVRQGLIALFSEEDTVEVVGEAANGREAVELVHRLGPDVVVMDVSMPVMSGEEATRQIKQDLPQTRIIALSMREDPEVRERMCQAGAECYVLKTAPLKELLAAIHGESPIPSPVPSG